VTTPPTVDLAAALQPLGEAWDQGDVVEAVFAAAINGDAPGVLLTPSCDIAQGKVATWTFVALFKDEDVAASILGADVRSWNLGSGEPSSKQHAALAKHATELLHQRVPRFHWLPVTIAGHLGWVADFTFITALPIDECKSATRVARLASSWREQLPARYAAYMSRVGTDDFHPAELSAHAKRLADVAVRKLRSAG